ncbi:MAG: hypothetical protein M3P29_08240, partial [Acidobacteriota bacterium]|nr:hypothetical protein [Acidobacteriota bacterium]
AQDDRVLFFVAGCFPAANTLVRSKRFFVATTGFQRSPTSATRSRTLSIRKSSLAMPSSRFAGSG